MTFRCSENDIFVAEKLLKPYGRLWVGNLVVSSSVRNFFCFCLLLVALTANLRRSIRLSHKKLVPGLAFQPWNKQLKVWEMHPPSPAQIR